MFERAIRIIREYVEQLNATMGWDENKGISGGSHRATFGYIGNCDADGGNDDRMWMIFLPHPGRVGTDEDRIGSFRTGDTKGAYEVIKHLVTAIKIAKMAKVVK